MNDVFLIAGAGLLAGGMNAIAGGGSFVTLPALIAAGVPALNANASSTVALVPSALASAYAYRHDFRGFDGVDFRLMTLISVAGGASGALLLLVTPQSVFAALVPFLLLFGTLAFAFGRELGARLREKIHITPHMMLAAQFVLGIYGGYFGGAVGIMMLATWSLLTSAPLSVMQPARNLLNAAMNATATLLFVAGGLVFWRQTFILLVGALIGGYFGALYGRRIPAAPARIVISCLNAGMTAFVFWRSFVH
jgi:uncharacterized protein